MTGGKMHTFEYVSAYLERPLRSLTEVLAVPVASPAPPTPPVAGPTAPHPAAGVALPRLEVLRMALDDGLRWFAGSGNELPAQALANRIGALDAETAVWRATLSGAEPRAAPAPFPARIGELKQAS